MTLTTTKTVEFDSYMQSIIVAEAVDGKIASERRALRLYLTEVMLPAMQAGDMTERVNRFDSEYVRFLVNDLHLLRTALKRLHHVR